MLIKFTTVSEAIYKNHNLDMVYQIKLKFFVCFSLTLLLQQYEMSKTQKLIFQKSTADISPWL
jgi:hypothetical protein